jgi:hypothetical protein
MIYGGIIVEYNMSTTDQGSDRIGVLEIGSQWFYFDLFIINTSDNFLTHQMRFSKRLIYQ